MVLSAAVENSEEMLKQAQKLNKDGNYKDAYELFQKLAKDSATSDETAAKALQQAVTCLRRLNRTKETDALLEWCIKEHQDDWRTLQAAAKLYMNIEHFGFMIAGEFERGGHRGGGEAVNSYQRDRVKALRLYSKVLKTADKQATPNDIYNICFEFAGALMHNRGYAESWRLQYLTNLKELPDYEKGIGYNYFG